jgi:MoxR-like ATPase
VSDNDITIPRLPAGEPVIDFIATNYRANQPVLLEGRHGVGKSSLFEEAARRLNIDYVVFDLSLMEATDLTGLPYVGEDRRSHYAPPARLPKDGKGLLVFEELNRAPELTRTPCLQLCTARRLNDYMLPEGFLPMAAINPRRNGYYVDELDASLTSRFNRATVEPDRRLWLEWAARSGIDPRITGFVDLNPKVFDDERSNPRSWAYVSKLLTAWEREKSGEFLPLVAGLVGEIWAVAFLRHCDGQEKFLTGAQVVAEYPAVRSVIQEQVGNGRVDVVQVTIERVQDHLVAQRANLGGAAARNIGQFLDDLPGDMQIALRAWLAQNGFRRYLKAS